MLCILIPPVLYIASAYFLEKHFEEELVLLDQELTALAVKHRKVQEDAVAAKALRQPL